MGRGTMPGNDAKEAKAAARELRYSEQQEPAAFAFAVAKDPADSILLVDDSKKPSTLVNLAARRSDGAVFSGMAYAEGSKAFFASDDAPSSGARAIDAWFKFHGIGMKAALMKAYAIVSDDEEEEVAEIYSTDMLIRRLRMARRMKMNFAFGPAKEAENTLLALHPRRDGKILFRGIRKENGAVKGSWGFVTTQGRVATFTVTGKILPEMRKKVRSFLFSRSLRYRVIISDGTEAPGAGPAAAAAEASGGGGGEA